VRVTDTSGYFYTPTTLVQVFDQNQRNPRLEAKWQALKNVSRIGDISGALSFAVQARQTEFQKDL
jgi:hypothetical protein